ncbi:MAG: Asp23/Gls24 family envelope stress response protein [Clostridiales bacterium]|nr:Asp23/Gls24 family envelope stress response protein [Clostridiales bacterium]
MAARKENLPLTQNQEGETTGTITYANEVVAVIAGVAANEVEGVAGMCTASTGISDVFSRNKNITKGVKVDVGTEEASVDVYLNVEYGTPIQTAATNVQESVRKSIETMTGLHVVRVDVHVQGVSFEKEKNDNLVGLESLNTDEETKQEAAPQTAEMVETVAESAIEPEAAPQEEPVAEEVQEAVEETVEEPVEEAETAEEPAESEE